MQDHIPVILSERSDPASIPCISMQDRSALDHTDFFQDRFLSPIIVYRICAIHRPYRIAYYLYNVQNTDIVSRRSVMQF